MTINKDTIRTPQMIFILYMIASSLIIICFRFIFPGLPAPLQIYSHNWRLARGVLEFFELFPALALSALVIPFGIVSIEEFEPSFSTTFFKHLLAPVVTAICAAVIYGAILFLVLPLVKNYKDNLLFKGELYELAKERAQIHVRAGEWQETSQFLDICERIWPESPELAALRTEAALNLDEMHFRENEEVSRARSALQDDHRIAEYFSLPGQPQPLDAAQAITMSETAYDERRYYDSHWLATLGERIAIQGSPEAAAASQLASRAWNQIESQAPSQREELLFSLYNLKRLGYQAMNSGDWIRGYYIFLELISKTPDDPDAAHFLAACEMKAKETAFFIDEMELSLGDILTGTVFSLPAKNGRAVLRFSSLSTSKDNAYGMGLEYMLFDSSSRLVVSLNAPYAKLLPFIYGGDHKVLILTHALDRHNEAVKWEGETLFGKRTEAGIILDISFEDFLLLSRVRNGLTNLKIDDLFEASRTLGSAGYVAQIFQAEMLNRLGDVIFFLPMAIIVIVIGWRYRAKTRPRYLFFPFFAILPVVFNGFVFLYRAVLNIAGIWLILSMSFSTAIIVYAVCMAVSLFLSLILLAAQHS